MASTMVDAVSFLHPETSIDSSFGHLRLTAPRVASDISLRTADVCAVNHLSMSVCQLVLSSISLMAKVTSTQPSANISATDGPIVVGTKYQLA